MSDFTISDVSNYISIISGVMTILGIGGVAAWGIFERATNDMAARAALILAYALKLALICFLMIPCLSIWKFVYIFVFQNLGDGNFSFVHPWWDDTQPIANVLAYVASICGTLTVFFISAACIFKFSFSPALCLLHAMRGQSKMPQ